MKILVINGPNINMLGIREPEIYGDVNYERLVETIKDYASSKDIEVDIIQSNSEGDIITAIQNAIKIYDGLIINPAAYTHYSYAIYDALLCFNNHKVEVHISNIYEREEFRHKSVTAPACNKQIYGEGINGYLLALNYILKYK